MFRMASESSVGAAEMIGASASVQEVLLSLDVAQCRGHCLSSSESDEERAIVLEGNFSAALSKYRWNIQCWTWPDAQKSCFCRSSW